MLGLDKVMRHKIFNDWLKEAQAKIEYMVIADNKRKVAPLKSWAGKTLLNFCEKEVQIRFLCCQLHSSRSSPR